MGRTHTNIISEVEMEQFLSGKTAAREGITAVTLTSDAGFVAKNLPVYGQKVMFV